MAKIGETRAFVLLLYTDTESYEIDNVLKILGDVFDEWAYILHDLDVLPDGTVKKEHIHVVGRCDNATSLESIAKKLGVPKNFVQNCHSIRGAVRYLIHADDADKYQYDVGDVNSNFDVKRYLKDIECQLKSKQIYKYISENEGISLNGLVAYCMANNLYSELRRGYSIFRDLIKESRGHHI